MKALRGQRNPAPYGARLAWSLVAALALAGCSPLPGQPDPAEKFQRPEEVTAFAPLFKKHCAGCHGADGKWGPAPPLNDPVFRAIVPEEELFMVVGEGRPGTSMPAFAKENGGPLTSKQVDIIVKGIKSHWGKLDPAVGYPPYGAAEAAPGNVELGKKVFARACAGCHGDHGEGKKSGALNQPAFLALISDQALRRLIITGRPDLDMPDCKGKAGRGPAFEPLSSEDVHHLVALLASWRQGSAGKK